MKLIHVDANGIVYLKGLPVAVLQQGILFFQPGTMGCEFLGAIGHETFGSKKKTVISLTILKMRDDLDYNIYSDGEYVGVFRYWESDIEFTGTVCLTPSQAWSVGKRCHMLRDSMILGAEEETVEAYS